MWACPYIIVSFSSHIIWQLLTVFLKAVHLICFWIDDSFWRTPSSPLNAVFLSYFYKATCNQYFTNQYRIVSPYNIHSCTTTSTRSNCGLTYRWLRLGTCSACSSLQKNCELGSVLKKSNVTWSTTQAAFYKHLTIITNLSLTLAKVLLFPKPTHM